MLENQHLSPSYSQAVDNGKVNKYVPNNCAKIGEK